MPDDNKNIDFGPSDEHIDFKPKVQDDNKPVGILVVGVGGGGSNAISHMYQQNVEGVRYVVINTDRQSLNNSPVPQKLLIGPTVTCGKGAGGDPEMARQAAEESADDIAAIFNERTDMVFLTAGMGGGTGTGAGPVVARIARERGILTIGIITIPFSFEGLWKIDKALDGAEEMKKYVDALMVINNELLADIYPDLDILNGFAMADETLTSAAHSISEIVTIPGKINCDMNDVDKTLRGGQTAIISCGYGEGENRTTKAIQDALNSPLLKNRDIMGSKRLLFNLYFSGTATDRYRMAETREIRQFIGTLDKNVKVIWGLAQDDSLGEKVKMTILAAGFDISISDEGEGKKINADTTHTSQYGPVSPAQSSQIAPPMNMRGEYTTTPTQRPVPAKAPLTEQERRARIANAYGEDTIDEIDKLHQGTTVVLLDPSNIDDDTLLAIEDRPTALRDRRENLNLQQSSSNISHGARPTSSSSSRNNGDKGSSRPTISFGNDEG